MNQWRRRLLWAPAVLESHHLSFCLLHSRKSQINTKDTDGEKKTNIFSNTTRVSLEMQSQLKKIHDHNDTSGHERPKQIGLWTLFLNRFCLVTWKCFDSRTHTWLVPFLATANAAHRSAWDAEPVLAASQFLRINWIYINCNGKNWFGSRTFRVVNRVKEWKRFVTRGIAVFKNKSSPSIMPTMGAVEPMKCYCVDAKLRHVHSLTKRLMKRNQSSSAEMFS